MTGKIALFHLNYGKFTIFDPTSYGFGAVTSPPTKVEVKLNQIWSSVALYLAKVLSTFFHPSLSVAVPGLPCREVMGQVLGDFLRQTPLGELVID